MGSGRLRPRLCQITRKDGYDGYCESKDVSGGRRCGAGRCGDPQPGDRTTVGIECRPRWAGQSDCRCDVFLLAVQRQPEDAHRRVHRPCRPDGVRRRGYPADPDGRPEQRRAQQDQTSRPDQRAGPVLHVHAPGLRLARRGKASEERRSNDPADRDRLSARRADCPHQHRALGHQRQLRRADGQSRHRAGSAGTHGGRGLQVGDRRD